MTKTIDMTPKIKVKGLPCDEDKKLHYFTSSAVGWACDDSLLKCIAKQKTHDKQGRTWYCKSFNLYSVPGPDTLQYGIDFFQPQVEGATYLGTIEY